VIKLNRPATEKRDDDDEEDADDDDGDIMLPLPKAEALLMPPGGVGAITKLLLCASIGETADVLVPVLLFSGVLGPTASLLSRVPLQSLFPDLATDTGCNEERLAAGRGGLPGEETEIAGEADGDSIILLLCGFTGVEARGLENRFGFLGMAFGSILECPNDGFPVRLTAISTHASNIPDNSTRLTLTAKQLVW